MQHFWMNLDGWYDYIDVHRKAVSRAASGATFVEVGVWKGASLAGLAVEVINSGKDIRVIGVDHFRGSNEFAHINDADLQSGNLKAVALDNLRSVLHVVELLEADSLSAAQTFDDASLDFVFIDGGHEMQEVGADIDAWLPKVRPGGILAGHDIDWPSVAAPVRRRLGHVDIIGRSFWHELRA